jgi:hypothetical protein
MRHIWILRIVILFGWRIVVIITINRETIRQPFRATRNVWSRIKNS